MAVDQLLGVPKLNAGTGNAQASAIAQVIEEWRLVWRISDVFDTTANNARRRNGTCVLLEQKLDKGMLHLACSHQIFQIALARVFQKSMGQPAGLDVAILNAFSLLSHS